MEENKINLHKPEPKKKRIGIKVSRGYKTSDTVHRMLGEIALANGFTIGDMPNRGATLDYLIRRAHEDMLTRQAKEGEQ